MKKSLMIFVLLLISISYVSAEVNFPASNVSVKIDGTDRTLQYAVDNGLLKGSHTYASASLTAIGQHDASQIWIRVASGEKTLLSALQTSEKLSAPSSTTSSYSSYTLNPGHNAREVILSNGKTFQAEIDSGIYVGCITGTTYKCGTDTTCKTYPTVTCTSSGVWPTCPSPSYAAKGTDCGSNSPTHPKGYSAACDGAGSCVGYSGTGCSNCPFSYTTTNGVSSCTISTSYIGRYYMTVGGWVVDCDDSYTVIPDDCWTNWITTTATGAVCSYHACGASGTSCTDTAMSWQIKPK